MNQGLPDAGLAAFGVSGVGAETLELGQIGCGVLHTGVLLAEVLGDGCDGGREGHLT